MGKKRRNSPFSTSQRVTASSMDHRKFCPCSAALIASTCADASPFVESSAARATMRGGDAGTGAAERRSSEILAARIFLRSATESLPYSLPFDGATTEEGVEPDGFDSGAIRTATPDSEETDRAVRRRRMAVGARSAIPPAELRRLPRVRREVPRALLPAAPAAAH